MFSSMFRKISVSKWSISLAFVFVRVVSSCFITNIKHFFSYAENIVIMRRIRILGNYADPHRRILSDAMLKGEVDPCSKSE